VSNTPIREALNRLSEEGYVYQIKNRGYFVSELSHNEVAEIYEIREALEVFAMRKIIRQGTKIKTSDKKQIKKMIDLYSKYVLEGNMKDRLPLDQKLHLYLACLSGNATLCNMLSNVFDRLNYKRKVVGLHPQRGVDASKEHQDIYHNLINSEPDDLINSIQNHLKKGKEKLLEMLKERDDYLKAR